MLVRIAHEVIERNGGARDVALLGIRTGGLFLAERLAGIFRTIEGAPPPLGAIDITVRRNAFGRQRDSFEADLAVEGLPGGKLHAVFIRAPAVERVGSGVEVLATVGDRPVLCRQGAVTVCSFHPELGDDLRLHQRFLQEIS